MQLDDLYQEIILDHYRRPRHFRKIPEAEAMVDEENPNCGDHIRLNAAVADGIVSSLEIECQGCAICTASSSMMAERLHGRPVAEARRWIGDFTALLTGRKDIPDDDLGDLVALKGVRSYPLRVKCATMAWHALESALDRLGA